MQILLILDFERGQICDIILPGKNGEKVMKKLLISLVALVATVGTSMAADNAAPCKQKKVRVIHITAGEPRTMYDDTQYTTTVLDSDGTVIEYPEYSEPEPLSVAPARRSSTYAGNWYIGGRVGLHLMSWKNKYHATPASAIADADSDHDNYSFEPVFGGSIFAGYRFTPNWRADVEFGYMTQFSDTDNDFTFKLSTPYLTANAYYDFEGGIYLGAGVGLAFPRGTMDWKWFNAGDASDTKLSFTGALMAGYSYYMTESLALDFRYRLAGFVGPKWTRTTLATIPDTYNGLSSLETKVGFVIDNSLSLGLRYEF